MKRMWAVLAAGCIIAPAFAHNHERPNFDSWYQSLERPNNGGPSRYGGTNFSCCNKNDCHETEAEIRDNDYWARLVIKNSDGTESLADWIRVPPEKVIHNKENPTGSPVICHTLAWNGPNLFLSGIQIYCFIPSFET